MLLRAGSRQDPPECFGVGDGVHQVDKLPELRQRGRGTAARLRGEVTALLGSVVWCTWCVGPQPLKWKILMLGGESQEW